MAEYDPTKKYTWSNDDVFEISGKDFGLLLNTFRALLSTEQATKVLMAQRANEVAENILSEYVEKGVVKEMQEDESPPMRVIKNDPNHGEEENQKKEVDTESNEEH